MSIKERIKNFAKNHKKELIMFAIGATAAGAGGYYLGSHFTKKPEEKVITNLVVSRYVDEELPLPDWGEHYDVFGHWIEASSRAPAMTLDTYLPCLGELGEKLMADCGGNPDIPVSVLINYGNN